jgi:hypothetical protein
MIDVTSYGRVLAAAVIESLPLWTSEIVADRAGPSHAEQALALGYEIAEHVEGPLLDLLTSDMDTQRQSPLALLRLQVSPLTDFLRSIGAQPARRDAYDEAAFPDDVYGVSPKSWTDFGDDVADAGLRWGAAKAMAHRQRHLQP